MIRHNIPGARKRRVRRDGPRLPTGWVRTEVMVHWLRFRWEHPDGRWFEACCGDWLSHDSLFYVDMTAHLGKGASHPGRFREQLPF